MQREHRLDRHNEDELWKRFSHARTTFDRKRRQYFGQLDEQRLQVRAAKERLIARAEELSTSTDWAATATAFRGPHAGVEGGRAHRAQGGRRAVGALPRAQDAFFAARTAGERPGRVASSARTSRSRSSCSRGRGAAAGARRAGRQDALRDIQDRWEAAGKVPARGPRPDRGPAARRRAGGAGRRAGALGAEQPAGAGPAQDAVDQLESTIAGLRKRLDSARASGSERAVRDAEQALHAREEWLEQARRALADFGG
jgi:hypothetical protein